MNFSDIKQMTYVGNSVIVDSRDIEITISLKEDITAVQFHKGNNFCLEEPLMQEVPLAKYQFVLDEFEKEKNILDTPKEVTKEDLITNRISEIDKRFKEIEGEKIRPLSSIKIAELKETEPDEYDVNKLLALEDQLNILRAERIELLK